MTVNYRCASSADRHPGCSYSSQCTERRSRRWWSSSSRGNGRITTRPQHWVSDLTALAASCRLGPLGFLTLPADKAPPGAGNGGLNGVNDLVVSLEWLQQHIKSFGGDPKKVRSPSLRPAAARELCLGSHLGRDIYTFYTI